MNRAALAIVAVLVAVATLGTLYMYLGRGLGASAPLSIETMDGTVVRIRGNDEVPGRRGMELVAGDALRTGPDGSATLSRQGRSPLSLGAGTTVQLLTVGDDLVEIELQRGEVHARWRPDAGAVRLSSGGRAVLANDATFAMRVADGGALSIEAEQGELVVEGLPEVWQLHQGERVTQLGDGPVRKGTVSADPLLDVAWPQASEAATVVVEGATEPGATVRLADGDGPGVVADAAGAFALPVPVGDEGRDVEVVAVDPFGREQRARGRIDRVQGRAPARIRVDVPYGRK